jgi:hypothetical protein
MRRRYTVATGRLRRSPFGWGKAAGGNGGAARPSTVLDSKIYDIRFSYPNRSRTIRPYSYDLFNIWLSI